jgi:cobalamin biosynthesis protein CbiG
MAHLEDYELPYEIVPGVTAVFAVAARLKSELTIPDLVQTVILTRTAGRTTMPAGEDLRTLATPGASLAIYLSVSRIRHVVDDLLASGGYRPETPVAVYHKVTWPDESCVIGTLADIVDQVKQAGYTKHALILVSPALDPGLKRKNRRTSSHLYDKSYTHRFRRAENFRRSKEQHEATGGVNSVVVGEKHLGAIPTRQGCAIIALTRRGSHLAATLAKTLNAQALIPAKHFEATLEQSKIQNLKPKIAPYGDSVLAEIRRRWAGYEQLILVMPSGVAVRAIAPLLGDKSTDPAVICLDEAGQSVIPLLGGHQAGANALAKRIAGLTGGHAAITTASDIQGKPALDIPPWPSPKREGNMTHASACLVNDDPIGVYVDPALPAIYQQAIDWLAPADNVTFVHSLDELDVDAYAAGLIISHQKLNDHHQHLLRKSALYCPPVLVAGLGCKRGVPASELRLALETTLAEAGLAGDSLAALATVDLKADEPGLQQLAAELETPLKIIESARLTAIPESVRAGFSVSAAQEKLGLPGVAEPCALLAAGEGGKLLVSKRKFDRCTVAVSLRRSAADPSPMDSDQSMSLS